MSDNFTTYALPLTPVDVATWTEYINEHIALINTIFNRTLVSIHEHNWINTLQDAHDLYDDALSFHNHRHILEVFQFGICLLSKNRNVLRNVSSKDLKTFVLASIFHDAGHIGLTNDQIMNDLNDLNDLNATVIMNNVWLYTKYDDDDTDYGPISDDASSTPSYASSYNENMHAELGHNVLEKHSIKYNRGLFAKLIRRTDLSHNGQFIEKQISYNPFYGNQIPGKSPELTERVLSLLLKIADVGHIVRPLPSHINYVINIHLERNPTTIDVFNIPSDTVYFNNTFVKPLLELLRDVNIGLSVKLLKLYDTNLQYWKSVEHFTRMANPKIWIKDACT